MTTTFNPVDFCFSWTNDGWYAWDRSEALKAARRARDAKARELKAEGKTVRKSSSRGNLITRGGIGSGRPEVSFEVPIYSVTVVIEGDWPGGTIGGNMPRFNAANVRKVEEGNR